MRGPPRCRQGGQRTREQRLPTRRNDGRDGDTQETQQHGQNRIEDNGKEVIAYVGNETYCFKLCSAADQKKIDMLRSLMDFKNEHGYTDVPKGHVDKQLYHYVRNIQASQRRKALGFSATVNLNEFERRVLKSLGVVRNDPFNSEKKSREAGHFVSLCIAGKAYRARFKHFEIFKDNEENNSFTHELFKDDSTSAIETLRSFFLNEFRRKKKGKDRLEKLQECLGLDMKNVNLTDLGYDGDV